MGSNKRKTQNARSVSLVYIIGMLIMHKAVDKEYFINVLDVADITLYKYIQVINLTLCDFNLDLYIILDDGKYHFNK